MFYQIFHLIKAQPFFKICLLLSLFALLTALVSCQQPNTSTKKIGIIIPIEHKAMNEIVAGFTETLKTIYAKPVNIKLANAQGDMNLEHAMIQQMRDDNYDIIIPIGTDASQMSISLIKNQPIISLASSLKEQARQQRHPCQLAIVHDEISVQKLLSFIHTVYPKLSRLVLFYSTAEKIFPEVEATIAMAKQEGIIIKPIMVPTLNDLYTSVNSIPLDAQAILVLKDHLIVSGIATLEMAAAKRGIPLIASDQGSVQDGASFALGVHEKDIGVEGAKLATSILSGKSPCDLPIVEMSHLTVFVNKQSLSDQNQSLDPILAAANKQRYKIEIVNTGNER